MRWIGVYFGAPLYFYLDLLIIHQTGNMHNKKHTYIFFWNKFEVKRWSWTGVLTLTILA